MKTEEMPLMHRRGGYEIRGSGDRIVFILRRTYGPGIAAAVTGGLAGIFIANGAVHFMLNQTGAGSAMLLAGTMILAVCALLLRTYLRRKKADPDEVPARYILDLAARGFTDAAGNTLARLEDVSFSCSYNSFSRVYGLYVQFPPKSRVLVYGETVAGFSSSHVKGVRDELERAIASGR